MVELLSILTVILYAFVNQITCSDSRVIASDSGTSATEGHLRVTEQNTTKMVGLDTENCNNPEKEFVSPVRGIPRCCRTCEPGTGMLRLCTDSEETQCIACEPGAEYSQTYSATAKCRPCRRCQDLHPLAKVRNACTPTADAVCDCVPGYYMDRLNQTCKPCSRCGPNEGVVRPCAWDGDAHCEACPKGFLSAKVDDTVKCVPCRTCSSDEVLRLECTPTSNTLCCPKYNTNCTVEELLVEEQLRNDENAYNVETGTRTHNKMLPIYCSIMGLIIVFLLFYVVYKLWKQREAMTNAKLSGDGYLPPGCNGTKCHAPTVHQTDCATLSHKSNNSTGNGPNMGGVQLLPTTAYEWDPLLNNGDECKNIESYNAILLRSLPPFTLGRFSFLLAQEGWTRLTSVINDDKSASARSQTSNNVNNPTYAGILRGAKQAQSSLEILSGRDTEDQPSRVTDEDLTGTVKFVADLCADQTMTVGRLMQALQSVGYDKLIPILSTIKQEPSLNLDPTLDQPDSGYSV